VLIFQSSAHLAAAYGFAVTGTFVCTTTLAAIVARHNWGWAMWKIAVVFTPLAIVDVAYFAANVSKIPHGAWFSLLLALILYTLMWSWSTSRQAMLRALSTEAVDVDDFAKRVASGEFKKTEGTGVFLVASPTLLPRTLLAALRNFGRIHETTILLTIQTLDTPFAEAGERCAVEDLAPGMFRVFLRFGFAESPDVPRALRESPIGERIEEGTTSYFVGRDTVAVTTRGPAAFPRRVFALLHRHAQVSTDFFRVPPDHTITMGARVEI
jgi:KUP system potassium uptake protein